MGIYVKRCNWSWPFFWKVRNGNVLLPFKLQLANCCIRFTNMFSHDYAAECTVTFPPAHEVSAHTHSHFLSHTHLLIIHFFFASHWHTHSLLSHTHFISHIHFLSHTHAYACIHTHKNWTCMVANWTPVITATGPWSMLLQFMLKVNDLLWGVNKQMEMPAIFHNQPLTRKLWDTLFLL